MTCVALSGCSCIAYTAAKLSINVSFALRVCTLVPCSSIIVYMQSILLIIMYIHLHYILCRHTQSYSPRDEELRQVPMRNDVFFTGKFEQSSFH